MSDINRLILIGDVRRRLCEIPDNSVQCVVTSPPYWGLRDYGHDGQIGLEQTPEEYVAEMVAVFREVRRVLKDDGTLWLNLGDSYFSTTKGTGGMNPETSPKNAIKGKNNFQAFEPIRVQSGDLPLKQKDLVGIPWRVAFALQADGWWLRQDIIWHKPNPMPESVTDRCTKAHEYLFLFTKSARYYFNHESIKERGVMVAGDSAGSRQRDTRETHGLGGGNDGLNAAKAKLAQELADKGYNTRNKRSVWTIPTRPFKGAHFAVMPEALVEPCILAGSKQGDLILDPFLGSGTVAVVAQRHARRWVGCELNPEYVNIIEQRVGLL